MFFSCVDVIRAFTYIVLVLLYSVCRSVSVLFVCGRHSSFYIHCVSVVVFCVSLCQCSFRVWTSFELLRTLCVTCCYLDVVRQRERKREAIATASRRYYQKKGRE